MNKGGDGSHGCCVAPPLRFRFPRASVSQGCSPPGEGRATLVRPEPSEAAPAPTMLAESLGKTAPGGPCWEPTERRRVERLVAGRVWLPTLIGVSSFSATRNRVGVLPHIIVMFELKIGSNQGSGACTHRSMFELGSARTWDRLGARAIPSSDWGIVVLPTIP